MGDVEQSAGMVMPGWGREVGPVKAPGGWRYRHHFRNKTGECSPPRCLMCLGWGKRPSHGQAHCSLAVQGRQGWGSVVVIPTSSAH